MYRNHEIHSIPNHGINTQNYPLRLSFSIKRAFAPTIFKKSETILLFFCVS